MARPGLRPGGLAAPQNLLVNSAFAGAASGTPGTGPAGYALISPPNALVVDADSARGGQALTFTASTQRHYIAASAAIPVLANTTYCLSVMDDAASITALAQIIQGAGAPAGTTLAYRLNGNTAVNSAIANALLIELLLTIGSTAGTITPRFGVGVASNAIGTHRLYAPMFNIGTSRASYIAT